MKLSILIPTCNRPNHVRKQIEYFDSIFNTTSIDFELVIGDNSTEVATNKYISNLNNSHVKYFKNEKNVGYDENVFRCFRHSSGDYIWLMGDKYYPLADCVNEIIQIIDCDNDAILIAQEKIIEQYVWHDPSSVLENFGARLSWLCSFIVKRDCLECLDRCNKYCGHNFIHIGILMEYLCKKRDIKVICISGYFDVWSHSKSYWEDKIFEVFSKDWFYTIMSIPNSISVDSKLKCLRGSNTSKHCFNPWTILRTKGSYDYSLKDLNDNRQFLELTSWTTYYAIFPIIILPNSIFKFARYLYKKLF